MITAEHAFQHLFARFHLVSLDQLCLPGYLRRTRSSHSDTFYSKNKVVVIIIVTSFVTAIAETIRKCFYNHARMIRQGFQIPRACRAGTAMPPGVPNPKHSLPGSNGNDFFLEVGFVIDHNTSSVNLAIHRQRPVRLYGNQLLPVRVVRFWDSA